ncbi:hypothetical protein KORDIASMS9_03818 [Kordia sp. SMS9]|uniref:DUF2461 domain-containing protein n=1 Tax=Kordia sp. SMS9 TaxID=2282170 RepID=UPI000E0D786B|nr:DUF2461 domain-containing protein [Kordia sp. SMS9]AXG71561.1 hypothetical protein KORDIASMS9_03818 [Kordia sp. SMS9]
MNKKKYIFKFLDELSRNNSKKWMDENRSTYQLAKTYWLSEVEKMLERLCKYDSHFEMFTPKNTIQRITNNRMFHPEKPIYKTKFAFSPTRKKDEYAPIFFSIGAAESLVGGGIWRPNTDILKKVRAHIDTDENKLQKAISSKEFVTFFGGLREDDQKLKTAPRGYDYEHPHIELLRYKNFTAGIEPTRETIINKDLADIAEEVYLKLKPMNDFFHEALHK